MTATKNFSTNYITLSNAKIDIKEKLSAQRENDLKYINLFKKHQLRVEPDDHYSKFFIITPGQVRLITELFPSIGEYLYKELNITSDILKYWTQGDLSAILAKGLILDSVKYSKHIAQSIHEIIFDSKLPDETIKICDVCVGVGITSSYLWLEYKNKTPDKKIQIHALDNSIESIAASICVFESQNIPYIVLKSAKAIKYVSDAFDGIVLIAADATLFLRDYRPTDLYYNACVSENGISYFPYEKHEETLGLMGNSTRTGGVVAIASLNPVITLNLNKLFMIKEIVTGKNKYEHYVQTVSNGAKQYGVKNAKINKAITKETGGQIEFLYHLLIKDFLAFVNYMKGLSRATKAAKSLVSEIHSPIETSKKIIEKSFPDWRECYQDWNVDNSPCEVLIIKV